MYNFCEILFILTYPNNELLFSFRFTRIHSSFLTCNDIAYGFYSNYVEFFLTCINTTTTKFCKDTVNSLFRFIAKSFDALLLIGLYRNSKNYLTKTYSSHFDFFVKFLTFDKYSINFQAATDFSTTNVNFTNSSFLTSI